MDSPLERERLSLEICWYQLFLYLLIFSFPFPQFTYPQFHTMFFLLLSVKNICSRTVIKVVLDFYPMGKNWFWLMLLQYHINWKVVELCFSADKDIWTYLTFPSRQYCPVFLKYTWLWLSVLVHIKWRIGKCFLKKFSGKEMKIFGGLFYLILFRVTFLRVWRYKRIKINFIGTYCKVQNTLKVHAVRIFRYLSGRLEEVTALSYVVIGSPCELQC